MKPAPVKIADSVVTKLTQWHDADDRAKFALLRHVFFDSPHRAWEVVRHFGPQAIGHPVYETVAGCFAHHRHKDSCPDDSRLKNFGATCREIAESRDDQPDKDDNRRFDARFRRLLACDTKEEVCEVVRQIIRLARSSDVKVNYRGLFRDLWWWNKRTKTEWAKEYWDVGTPKERGLADESALADDDQPAVSLDD